MKSVANLENKAAPNSRRIVEGASCTCYPGLVFNYDSRRCRNVAGPDKPTLLLAETHSKDTLMSLVSLSRLGSRR